MKTIGLTGGIGSGKSTVASMFEGLGAAVCDADQVNRDLIGPGGEAVPAVLQAFGRSVEARDGGVDRRALSRLVFSDPEKRALLQSITHPLIMRKVAESVENARKQGKPAFVLEAALLVETGLYKGFDFLVVVTAGSHAAGRAAARDGVPAEEVQRRIQAQAGDEERMALADFVIDNSGDLERTREQVERIWRKVVTG